MAKVDNSTPSKSIEVYLQEILDQTDSHIWTIRDLFQAIKGKGYPCLVVLLSLPFCQPIQIPGFSTPFGIILIFIGLRMIFGRRIWWPQWMLKQQISPKLLKAIVEKSLRFFHFLTPLLHERWSWICNTPFFYRMHGGFITLMGFYLALPLPIPLSNILAAWALFLVGLGILEDDGLFICIGYGFGLITIALLGYLILWLGAWWGGS